MPTFIIQLPNQNCTNFHLKLLPNSSKLPSIGKFLNHSNHKHNCDVYTKFEDTFLEEEITINVIKDLTDKQLHAAVRCSKN